ncbi:ArsC/Spx/MgsR family protein [Lyngbya aestuarii]|uniref:ArsC/Spx/MgsR family protein n=1 Tax=Lyngbya aestuarii TaxID=118322 RepID=UPI00403E319E
MAKVIFYEKPGCINNTKQKALLKAAGHEVIAHNLLTQSWQVEELRLFFGELPVSEWFNRTAPRIKSGEVVPEKIDVETALALMVNDPILIRRPLIQVDERREVGFDTDLLNHWISLKPLDEADKSMSQSLMSQDLQSCPNSHNK